jgi:hypothetical protein
MIYIIGEFEMLLFLLLRNIHENPLKINNLNNTSYLDT